jgi:hypothetical protein
MPTKTEEKNDKSEKQHEKGEGREKTELRERNELREKRAIGIGKDGCDDDDDAEKAKEERERWQKPPEPEFSKENLALLKEFAKKAVELRKLLADKHGQALEIPSRFVGALAGAVNMARSFGTEGLEEEIEPIPREGHTAHSTDPPMSLAYAPPGVNPEPWVPREPLDRLGLGPDARLLTSETAAPADGEGGSGGGGTEEPRPLITLSPTSAPQGAGGFVLAITGTNTSFASGQTKVTASGSGITFGTVKVNSATALEVPTTVLREAAPGERTVTVTTGSESAKTTFTVT